MKDIKLIQNKIEYEAALAEAGNFFDDEPSTGSKEAARFEVLLRMIEVYESKYYAVSPPGESEPGSINPQRAA
jgi:HTH-type transcriptional regulator/antitoxin HigA